MVEPAIRSRRVRGIFSRQNQTLAELTPFFLTLLALKKWYTDFSKALIWKLAFTWKNCPSLNVLRGHTEIFTHCWRTRSYLWLWFIPEQALKSLFWSFSIWDQLEIALEIAESQEWVLQKLSVPDLTLCGYNGKGLGVSNNRDMIVLRADSSLPCAAQCNLSATGHEARDLTFEQAGKSCN